MAGNKSLRAHSIIATIRYLHPNQGTERHNRTHLLKHHPLAHMSNKRRGTRKNSKKSAKKTNKKSTKRYKK